MTRVITSVFEVLKQLSDLFRFGWGWVVAPKAWDLPVDFSSRRGTLTTYTISVQTTKLIQDRIVHTTQLSPSVGVTDCADLKSVWPQYPLALLLPYNWNILRSISKQISDSPKIWWRLVAGLSYPETTVSATSELLQCHHSQHRFSSRLCPRSSAVHSHDTRLRPQNCHQSHCEICRWHYGGGFY